MTFKIAYYANDQKHITLHPDGSIELFDVRTDEENRLVLSYSQASILKRMIIAQHELEKSE